MTRLVAEQVRTIATGMAAYDHELREKQGFALRDIALAASGPDAVRLSPEKLTVFVITITAGLGAIGGFSEAVRAIAAHLGFKARLSSSPDVGGMVEAYRGDADAVLLADDEHYVAINLHSRRVVHNDEATARGYAAALAWMAGGLEGKVVLLIGAGAVGKAAAQALCAAGAQLIVYDGDRRAEKALVEALSPGYPGALACGLDLDEALAKARLIFDASPARNLIGAQAIRAETIIAAPGLPLGLTAEARRKIGTRLIHDPLQIGTAVMLYSVFNPQR